MATLPSDHNSMDSIPQLTGPDMQQESISSLDQSHPQPRQSPTKRVKSSDAPKMTQSCTRCRQKKLKCDSQVPCNGCISRGLEAECQKEVALKRGRAKRPRLEDGSTAPKKTEKEVETLRKRLVELEEKLEAKNEGSRQVPHQGSSKDQTNSPQVESLSSSSRILDLNPSYNRGAFGYPSSSHSSTVETPSLIHTNSNRSPDSHSVQERPSQSPVDRSSIESPPHLRPQAFHVEASASILENFASSSHRGPSLPLPRIPALSIFSSKIHVSDLRDDQQNSYWARSESLARRLEFIKEARASIPEPIVLEEMLRIFWLRCNHICSHVVNRVRSSRAIALFMSKPTVEDILMEPSFIDPSALSVTLLILLLAAKFYPENPGKASRSELDQDGRPSSAFQAVHKFLRSQGDVQSTWHRLAKEGLAIEHSYELTSSPAIVSACLLIVLGRDQQSYLKMLLDLAIRSAQAMNFHMLGEGMAPLEEEEDVRGNGNWEERRRRHLEAVIRREESCRIWWFLASRDWTFGQRDSTYRIHPSQFNSSQPLNLEDEDLSMGIINFTENEEKWTEMTYPIAQIKLSEIIRLSIDLKNEAHSHFFGSNTWSAASCQVLHSALNNFLRDLPSFYRVDAPLGTVPPITNIQRYLLHLQAFDLLLKVHRHNLGDTEGRKSCLSLANIMLTTQQTMRTICPVIDSFKINTTHTFSAAVVIIIDLLLDSQAGYRREAREKVSKALLCLQRSPESQRAVRILQALLEVEEKQALSSSPPEERTKALMELSKRLVDLSEGESLFSPTSSSRPMTPDETVAPGLASPWNIQTPDQMAASMWIRGDNEHDLKTSSADFHLPPLLSFPSRDVRTSSPSLFSLEKGDVSGDWESHWSRSSQPQSRSQPQTQPQPQPQRQWSHMDTLSSFSQNSHPSDSHQYAYGGNQTFQHQRDNASHSHSPSNLQQPHFLDSQTHQQYSRSSYMPQTNEYWNSRS